MATVVSPTTRTVSIADLREVVAVAIARYPDQRGRIEKAAAIVLLRAIRPDPCFLACYQVESESQPGRFYDVDLGVGHCSCPDYEHRGVTCGHQWALKLLGALGRLHRSAASVAA
jgi:hypothetical protein